MYNDIETSEFEKPFFRHPFTSIIAGPTSCGKTVFTSKFIKYVDQLVKPLVDEVIYCYAIWQPVYVDLQKENHRVKFLKGLPDFDKLPRGVKRLVVVDDMISELNGQIETMFIRGSHHLSISLMLICQNVFSRVKMFRNLSLNAHYIICFKQPRDASQILHLARQISPRNIDFVCDSFYKATSEAFGYLLFDFKQDTPDILRLRTKIFPGENLIVFIPQK